MEQLTVDLAGARDAAFDWQAEDAVARELAAPHALRDRDECGHCRLPGD